MKNIANKRRYHRNPESRSPLLERFENEWREMRTVGEAAQKTVPLQSELPRRPGAPVFLPIGNSVLTLLHAVRRNRKAGPEPSGNPGKCPFPVHGISVWATGFFMTLPKPVAAIQVHADQQRMLLEMSPALRRRSALGRTRWTSFYFVGADDELVRQSMETAWRNVRAESSSENGRH